MNKQKVDPKQRAKRPTTSKNTNTRSKQAVSADDHGNQNQIDQDPQTMPGVQPRRKPVTNTDEQDKATNTDSSDEEAGGYEGPNDPGKRGDDPEKTRRELPRMN